MYPVKEILRYYVADIEEDESKKVNITIPSLFRNLLSLEVGEEIFLFFDEKNRLLCIKKASTHCSDCGVLGEEEKVVEIAKDLYFCEKCLDKFMKKVFGRGLSR